MGKLKKLAARELEEWRRLLRLLRHLRLLGGCSFVRHRCRKRKDVGVKQTIFELLYGTSGHEVRNAGWIAEFTWGYRRLRTEYTE